MKKDWIETMMRRTNYMVNVIEVRMGGKTGKNNQHKTICTDNEKRYTNSSWNLPEDEDNDSE